MPHPSFLSCLPGIVVARSSSKHFRRVTHCRGCIEHGQSVLPPTLLANLLDKNLLKNARGAVTSAIVDTRGCKLRRSANATAEEQPCVLSMQLDGAIEPARMVSGLDFDEQIRTSIYGQGRQGLPRKRKIAESLVEQVAAASGLSPDDVPAAERQQHATVFGRN